MSCKTISSLGTASPLVRAGLLFMVGLAGSVDSSASVIDSLIPSPSSCEELLARKNSALHRANPNTDPYWAEEEARLSALEHTMNCLRTDPNHPPIATRSSYSGSPTIAGLSYKEVIGSLLFDFCFLLGLGALRYKKFLKSGFRSLVHKRSSYRHKPARHLQSPKSGNLSRDLNIGEPRTPSKSPMARASELLRQGKESASQLATTKSVAGKNTSICNLLFTIDELDELTAIISRMGFAEIEKLRSNYDLKNSKKELNIHIEIVGFGIPEEKVQTLRKGLFQGGKFIQLDPRKRQDIPISPRQA